MRKPRMTQVLGSFPASRSAVFDEASERAERPWWKPDALALGDGIRSLAESWNKLVVGAYKAAGFVFLSAILLGLVSYLGIHAFFFVNSSWLTPAVVSPTDPKVLAASSQLAQETLLRDKLMGERQDLMVEVRALERSIAIEESYQRRMRGAVATDMRVTREQLEDLRRLAGRARVGEREISETNRAFSGMSRDRMDQLLAAKMIEKNAYLDGRHQLAALELTNLSLSERSVSLNQNVSQLERQALALDAMRGDLDSVEEAETETSASVAARPTSKTAMTYELVALRHEYDRSVADVEKARDRLNNARAAVFAVDAAVSRHERLIDALQDSPFYRAWEKKLTVAFVPYENLGNAQAGIEVFACHLGPVVCERIARVREVLPGEVTARHPVRGQELRGVLVELSLEGKATAEQAVLHAGKPFGF